MTQTLDKPARTSANPGRILDLSWGIARTGALTAALDLDVFTHVEEGAATAADVAERCGADPGATATLLTCIASLGLLRAERGDGEDTTYALAPDAEAFLVRTSPKYLGDLRHMHHEINFPRWPRLAETVVRGAPSDDLFATDGSEIWTKVTPYLDQLANANAGWLTKALAHALPADPRILDLGCGSGACSRMLARTSSGATVVAVDRPEVVEQALRRAADAGLGDRIEGRGGDLRDTDWDGPYDLVLLSNVLHGYDATTSVELLRRAASVLAPGGRVAVFEIVVDPRHPLDNPVATFFSLQMLQTSGGRAHSAADYATLLRDAGLEPAEPERCPAGPGTLMTAQRPNSTQQPTTRRNTMSTVTGLDFAALQVHDVEASAEFYSDVVGLKRAPEGPPGAVVFATKPIPFAVREPTIDLDAADKLGWGVALWFHADDVDAVHERVAAAGRPILAAPFDGPFGRTFSFADPDGYAVTLHDKA